MIVETLMIGTQGQKAHIVYKECKASIEDYVIDYLFCCLYDFLHSLAVQLRLLLLVIHNFHYLKMNKYCFQIYRSKVHENFEFQKSHGLHYPQYNFSYLVITSPPLLEDPSWVQTIYFNPNCHPFFTMSCLLAQILCFSDLQDCLLLFKPTNQIILLTLP